MDPAYLTPYLEAKRQDVLVHCLNYFVSPEEVCLKDKIPYS